MKGQVMSRTTGDAVEIGVCTTKGIDLVMVNITEMVGGLVTIKLVEATDAPFMPFAHSRSVESVRVEVKMRPEDKPHFMRFFPESNSRLVINNQDLLAQLGPEQMMEYRYTVWASANIDEPDFPGELRIFEVPVSHHLVVVAGKSKYAALIKKKEEWMGDPNIQRFLSMSREDHAAALARLQQSADAYDEPELYAASQAWSARLKLGHISSGETSDHPEVDGYKS